MAKKLTVRSAWKQAVKQKTAAFLFPHGIELLALESEDSQKQLDKMLADFRLYLCGIYDSRCPLEEFREDMEFLAQHVTLDATTRKQVFH